MPADWHTTRRAWNAQGQCARETCRGPLGDPPAVHGTSGLHYCDDCGRAISAYTAGLVAVPERARATEPPKGKGGGMSTCTATITHAAGRQGTPFHYEPCGRPVVPDTDRCPECSRPAGWSTTPIPYNEGRVPWFRWWVWGEDIGTPLVTGQARSAEDAGTVARAAAVALGLAPAGAP